MAAATGNPIEDRLIAPIPEKLCHYTSLQGFQGIVTSKSIFATDIRYLNDREEFIHAQAIVDRVTSRLDEVDANGFEVRRLLRQYTEGLFARGVLSPKHLQIFVASFSTAEDQLSQWRGYSRGSAGACLCFDLRNIRRDPLLKSLSVFAQCIYKDDQKEDLISRTVNGFAQEASEAWRQMSDQEELNKLLHELMQKNPGWSAAKAGEELKQTMSEWVDSELKRIGAILALDLLRLGALMKHSSFEEEQEWRLVLPMAVDSTPKVHPRRFRVSSTRLVPFIEFDLAEGGRPFPLSDVILGPGSEPVTAVDAARSFLESEGLGVVPRLSSSPFRPR